MTEFLVMGNYSSSKGSLLNTQIQANSINNKPAEGVNKDLPAHTDKGFAPVAFVSMDTFSAPSTGTK